MTEQDPSGAGLREPPVTGVERRNGSTVVRLAGELDLYNAPALRAALLDATHDEPGVVVLDLAAVRFMDSTTLGVLVEARSKIGAEAFVLAAPGLETRRALEVSGLDRVFVMHETVEAALTPGS